MSTPLNGLVLADFSAENLAAYLRGDTGEPAVQCEAAPLGQVTQCLIDAKHSCWKSPLDFAVVWTRPESVLASFNLALAGFTADTEAILAEVDDYAQALLAAADRARMVFVPTWVVPTFHHGHGMLDLSRGVGVARHLMQANLRLLERLDQAANIVPMHAAKWIEIAGDKAFNARLWYLGKVPFGNELFKAAVRDIKAALRGMQGRARKLIILDLDETLWGGIVGEVGWRNLRIGGHDPIGEAIADFQKELKALTRRGVVLAIASKNEESVALEAINQHPEMVLRQEDFAGWRINWQDKAQNIADLAAELNLGLHSTVFIDDNPTERGRVRAALPDVLVPEWPVDKRLYADALRQLDCFDKPFISDEDRQRSKMYVAERQRAGSKATVESLDKWLETVSLTVKGEALGPANLARAGQLLNKTNQMNLSTRRMTDSEFLEWLGAGHRRVWCFSVSDKFGDSGLTGILSIEANGQRAQIVDFVLSCRVMGRKIEEAMLHVAVEWARSVGLQEAFAVYSPTPKNKPCLDFFERSGFQGRADNRFAWVTDQAYPLHSAIRLVVEAHETTQNVCAAVVS